MSLLPRLIAIATLAASPHLAGCAKAAPGMARPVSARPATGKPKPSIYKPPSVSSASTGSLGGAARAGFLTEAGAIEPAAAPAGDRLAFRVPGRGLFVATSEGKEPRPVTASTPEDRDPAWTEAGDLLVAVRLEAGGSALVALPPGGKAERLFASKHPLKQPAFVPGAGGWLVVEEAGVAGKLLKIARNGVLEGAIAEAPLLASPTVSADGRWAVVERRGARGGSELARIDLASGASSSLTVEGTNPRRPRLAPGGRQLAYLADEGLFVADAEGRGGRRVSTDRGFTGLTWHPRLPQLLVGAREGGRSDVLRVEL